jgi:uncharacterized protein YbaR (Trm112 family)
MKKKVVLDVVCPFCHHSLMDEEVEIKGLSSVYLNIRSEDNKKGTIHLCAAYECFEHQKDIPIEDGEILGLCCPYCHKELLTQETCQVCGAPMADLRLASGGFVRICSRFGCFNHFLSLADQESAHETAH